MLLSLNPLPIQWLDQITELDPKTGTSHESDLQLNQPNPLIPKKLDKLLEFAGSPLPPHLVRMYELEANSDLGYEAETFLIQKPKPKKHSDKTEHKSHKYLSFSSSSEESEVSAQV